MATIKVGVEVSDGGSTAKVNTSAEKLKNTLEGAAKAANSIRVPTATAAAQQGVAASNAVKNPSYSKAVPSSGQGETKTSRSIGMGAGTGSAASDFAAQAQGLGGLVHLYATFAANLYAASAAFGALSKSMDTVNLVKGLDQLGISSGRNLGSLAKQMVNVADGAISLRDAMSSTAMASSGGMTNAAILRMTQVAKNASLALGRDLPDSMERLTKGIVKIQPELLDELGIMTRVIPAQQAYAQSIGKTISSLTDFEKRQAFANAVLTEGEKKFGSIKLDANPYSKVLASMTNLMQSGLELLNKVLGPLMSMLASSPTALMTVMAGIAAMLVKQAIPAIQNYKAGLTALTEGIKARAEISRDAANKQFIEQENLNIKTDAAAEKAGLKAFKIAETTKLKIASLQQDTKLNKFVSPDIKAAITTTSALDLTSQDLAAMKHKSDTILAEDTTQGKRRNAGLVKYIKEAEALRAEHAAAGETARELSVISDKQGNEAMDASKKKSEDLNQKAALDNIRANALKTQSEKGFIAAIRETNIELGKGRTGGFKVEGVEATIPKINALKQATQNMSIGFDLAKAGVMSMTNKIGSVLSVLGPWGTALGIVTSLFGVLDEYMSTGSKQIAAFGVSLDATTSSTKLLSDVSKNLLNQDLSKWLSVESMNARANAIYGTSDAVVSMIKDLNTAKLNSNWWDNMFDGLFSKSRVQKTAVAITASIVESVKLARPSAAKDEFNRKITEVTGASSARTIDSSKLTEDQLKSLSSVYAKFGTDMVKEAEKLSAPGKAIEEMGKKFTDLSASLMPTDNISKFGLAILDVGIALNAVAEDTNNYFQALQDLSNDTSKLAMLDTKSAELLRSKSKDMEVLSTTYGQVEAAVQAYSNAIEENQAIVSEAMKTSGGNLAIENQTKAVADAINAITALKQAKADQEKTSAKLVQEKADFSKQFITVGGEAISRGLLLFQSALDIVMAQGALKISSAIAGAITGVGSSEAKAAVAIKEIDIRITGNNIMLDLVKKQELATLAMTANTNVIELATAASKLATFGSKGGITQAEQLDLIAKVRQLELAQKGIVSAQGIVSGEGSMKTKWEAAAKGTPEQATGAAMTKDLMTKSAKVLVDNSVAASEKAVIRINEELGKTTENYSVINRYINDNISKLEDQFKITSSLANSGNSMKLQELANTTAIDIEEQKGILLIQERGKVEADHATKLKNAGFLTKAETDNYNDQLDTLKQKTDRQTASNKASQAARDIADVLKQSSIDAYKLEGLRLAQEQSRAKDLGSLTNATNELDSLHNIGAINDIIYTQEKGILDLKILSANKSAEIANTENTASLALQTAKDKLATGTISVQGNTAMSEVAKQEALNALVTQYTESILRSTTAQTTSISLTEAKFNSDSKVLAQATTYNTMLTTQADNMTKMVDITNSLATVFGTLGESIGKAGEAILKMGNDQKTGALASIALEKEKADIISKLPEGSDPKDKVLATKDVNDKIAKLDKKSALDQVSNIGNIAGASKKLFNEQSTAYKVLDKVEKASHLMKMYNDNKELVTTIFNLGKKATMELGFLSTSVAAEETADMAKATSKVPAVIMEFMTWLGPWGTAAAAAAIAAVLGSSGGGGGTQVDMTGMTSADRQATQGTGQSWQIDATGTRVKTDTGGGVFGDSEAKSTSIVASLEIMRANSIEGLDYDKSMLKALEKLADSVTGAAKSLYAIPGLRAGKGFGTEAGDTSTAGFGASIPIVGKLLSSIFGGGTSSSASITSAGLELKGSFAKVAEDTAGSITQYKDVLTRFHKDGGWFGSDRDWSTLSHQTQALKAGASTAISDIFKDANNLFNVLGGKAGVAANAISDVLSNFDVSMPIDIMNLTGQALIDELNAVIGAKISDAARQIFVGFDRYKNFGEDYLATVVRVVDGNDKVNMSLKSIGHSFNVLQNFNVSEAMIKNANGLEALMSETASFKDNFLTTAEKLAPVQKGVTDQLKALHINTDISRNDFKKLVLSQDLSTKAGQDMYQSLMELQPGFNAVTSAIDSTAAATLDLQIALLQAQGYTDKALQLTRAKALKSMSAEDAAIQRQVDLQLDANKTRGLENTLLSAQGKASQVLQRNRELELLGLSAVDATLQVRINLLADEAAKMSQEAAIYTALGDTASALVISRTKELAAMTDLLKPGQEYLYALQDESTLKTKLTTAYNAQATALKSTITSLTASIKTLKDYRTALTGGASSILTPAQKYAQAKANLYQTSAAASANITASSTTAEIAARDTAISQLSSTSDTFLALSKEMYASSAQYTTDYTSVLDLLDSTSGILVSQQTDAQKQLEALDASVSFLTSIADSTDTVAQLLTKYYAQQGITVTARDKAIASGSVAATTAIPGFATGGYASGLALVGEKGPELVDFRTPGRVYSNKASNDLLSNADLINEIKALRQEVTQLRADQREQTGHLIATNYDANNRNANAVSDATAQAAKQQEWKQRSQVKVA